MIKENYVFIYSQDAPKDLKDENTGVIEDSGPKQLDGVHLLFHIEAAELLPLIVRYGYCFISSRGIYRTETALFLFTIV